MKKELTGKTAPAERTDWQRVRTMADADIQHDADSPATVVADWEGATLKQAGVEVGRAKTRGSNRRPTEE